MRKRFFFFRTIKMVFFDCFVGEKFHNTWKQFAVNIFYGTTMWMIENILWRMLLICFFFACAIFSRNDKEDLSFKEIAIYAIAIYLLVFSGFLPYLIMGGWQMCMFVFYTMQNKKTWVETKPNEWTLQKGISNYDVIIGFVKVILVILLPYGVSQEFKNEEPSVRRVKQGLEETARHYPDWK